MSRFFSAVAGGVLVVRVCVAAVFAQRPDPAQGRQVPGADGSPAAPGAARGPVAPPPPLTQAAIDKAAPILAAAREALGGQKLMALKSLDATGRTRRVRGNNLVPIEFELNVEFPDRYVRKDESPAEEAAPTSVGFAGTDLLQNPPPAAPPARAGAPPTPQAALDARRAQLLLTAKQEFARIALGLFAQGFPAYPLTFGYAAQAQAPQGVADVLDVRGEGNFAVRFFIDQTTHLPIMVSWASQLAPNQVIVTVPDAPPLPTIAPGAVVIIGPAAPPATATQEQKDEYAKAVLALRNKALATPAENRIYFADYRDVDGLKLPFRLRRAIGPDTSEETTFDRYRINPKIPPAKFAIPK